MAIIAIFDCDDLYHKPLNINQDILSYLCLCSPLPVAKNFFQKYFAKNNNVIFDNRLMIEKTSNDVIPTKSNESYYLDQRHNNDAITIRQQQLLLKNLLLEYKDKNEHLLIITHHFILQSLYLLAGGQYHDTFYPRHHDNHTGLCYYFKLWDTGLLTLAIEPQNIINSNENIS